VTLVLEGASTQATEEDASRTSAREVFEAMLDDALKPRERAKRIAGATGLDPRDVYERLAKR